MPAARLPQLHRPPQALPSSPHPPWGGGAGTPGGRKRPAPPGPASRSGTRPRLGSGAQEAPSSGSALTQTLHGLSSTSGVRSPSQRPPPRPDPTAQHLAGRPPSPPRRAWHVAGSAMGAATPGPCSLRTCCARGRGRAPSWCQPHREGRTEGSRDPRLRGDSRAGGWGWWRVGGAGCGVCVGVPESRQERPGFWEPPA